MIDNITPVILTYNEASNIVRVLNQLHWAKDIIVVDSFSNDETLLKLAKCLQVRIFQRIFDSHEDQWNFAIKKTDIRTEWILALDADYVLSDELVSEMETLNPAKDVFGYQATFKYCVFGRPLRGTVYPPVTVLYRRENAFYKQDGHTQRIVVDGIKENLRSPILHDDRKSINRWLLTQNKYMKLEADKLIKSSFGRLGWADRLRKLRVVFPFIMFFYCLFVKGTVFDGSAGLYYSFQRMLAETLLSLRLIQHDCNGVADAKE
jgi:glycosyltransferase involved in cell wall biosynthesis